MYEPIGNRLLIEVPKIKGHKTLDSGLLIPGTLAEDPVLIKGRILKAGPGRYYDDGEFRPIQFSVGMAIFFLKNLGTVVHTDEDRTLYIIIQDLIVAGFWPKEVKKDEE